jgi:hypothetical protein
MKDKKNVANQLRLILPVGENVEMRIVEVAPDEIFQHQCQEFLKAMH